LAQKVKLSVPRIQSSDTTEERQLINWGMLIAVTMLVVWAIGTALEWSGWVHALLTVGVFLLVRAIVNRKSGTRVIE
jgi:predicted ferric reductase